MDIKTIWKASERHVGCLSHLKTTTSRRRYPAEEDEDVFLSIVDPYGADIPKITDSKSYRVQADLTQVYNPSKSVTTTSLTRRRITHVMEIAGQAQRAARILGLNADLVFAAGLAHDTGHTPYGHPGEDCIKRMMGKPFCHEGMGVVKMQKIERSGAGVNACWETLNAMLRHSGKMANSEMSQEAWVLRYIDKLYVFHDYNDIFIRTGYPRVPEIDEIVNFFGANQRARTNTMIAGLVLESAACGRVSFQYSELAKKFTRLRELMYKIYPKVVKQDVEELIVPVFRGLERLSLCNDPFLLLTLMTDKDVNYLVQDTIDFPAFMRTSVAEILPRLPEIERRHGKIDLCDPDLDTW